MQASASAERRVGTRLGEHRLTDLLHATAVRAIYRGEREDGAVHLLMVLDDTVAADPVVRERFEGRMRQAAGVLERHLVPLRSWGVVDGALVAELSPVTGTGLRTWLEHEPMTVPQVLAIAEPLAAAIDAAHARGLAHLGLSPSVVVVGETEPAGGPANVWLTDLGVAATLTEAGLPLDPADIGYRPPGSIVRPIDPASREAVQVDLWALRCLLHDAITGLGPVARAVEVPRTLAQLLIGPAPSGPAGAADLVRAARVAVQQTSATVLLAPRGSGRAAPEDPDATAVRFLPDGPAVGAPSPATPRRAVPAWTSADTAVAPASTPARPVASPSTSTQPLPPPPVRPAAAPVPVPRSTSTAPRPRQDAGRARRRSSLVPGIAMLLAGFALLATAAVAFLWANPTRVATITADEPAVATASGAPTAPAPASPGPDQTTPAALPTLPAGAVECTSDGAARNGLSGSASGSEATSCEFAEATRLALAGESDPFAVAEIEARSPVTEQTYTLACSSEDRLITCTGGTGAVVLVW